MLTEQLLFLCDRHCPVPLAQLLSIAKGIAKDFGIAHTKFVASKKWLRGFLLRNKELSKRTSTRLSRAHSVNFNSASAAEWYAMVEKILPLYKPTEIFNTDDTGLGIEKGGTGRGRGRGNGRHGAGDIYAKSIKERLVLASPEVPAILEGPPPQASKSKFDHLEVSQRRAINTIVRHAPTSDEFEAAEKAAADAAATEVVAKAAAKAKEVADRAAKAAAEAEAKASRKIDKAAAAAMRVAEEAEASVEREAKAAQFAADKAMKLEKAPKVIPAPAPVPAPTAAPEPAPPAAPKVSAKKRRAEEEAGNPYARAYVKQQRHG